MAILQDNWLIIVVVTAVSLGASWYYGGHGRRMLWTLCGIGAALIAAVSAYQLGWADVTTAIFAYGILIMYCPMLWIIANNKHDETATGDNISANGNNGR